jgi:hypothetical protein
MSMLERFIIKEWDRRWCGFEISQYSLCWLVHKVQLGAQMLEKAGDMSAAVEAVSINRHDTIAPRGNTVVAKIQGNTTQVDLECLQIAVGLNLCRTSVRTQT